MQPSFWCVFFLLPVVLSLLLLALMLKIRQFSCFSKLVLINFLKNIIIYGQYLSNNPFYEINCYIYWYDILCACLHVTIYKVSFRVLPFGVGSARSSSSLASVTNNVPYDRSQDLIELEGSTSLSRVSTPPEIPDTQVFPIMTCILSSIGVTPTSLDKGATSGLSFFSSLKSYFLLCIACEATPFLF